MPYAIDWCIPQHVVILTLFGDISPQDLEGFNNDLLEMLSTTQNYVHVAVDLGNVMEMPLTAMEIVELLPFMKQENLGWVLVCNASLFLKLVASVVFHVTKTRIRFLATTQEALPFLYNVDYRLEVSV